MRELMEQGFEVAVVSDATAAAIVEEGDGYQAALVEFRFIANTVWKNVKAAYNNPTMCNDDALRFLLTLGATKWQEYLREHQPPTLIVWGKNDENFPAIGGDHRAGPGLSGYTSSR